MGRSAMADTTAAAIPPGAMVARTERSTGPVRFGRPAWVCMSIIMGRTASRRLRPIDPPDSLPPPPCPGVDEKDGSKSDVKTQFPAQPNLSAEETDPWQAPSPPQRVVTTEWKIGK